MNTKTYGTAVCPFCNKEFTKTSPRQKVCKDDHYAPCPDCGKPVKIVDKSYAMFIKNGPKRCKDCANAAISVRAKSKTAEEQRRITEKRKQTNLSRFGTEYATQNGDIKQKQIDTCMQRYGTSTPLQNEEIKQTMQEHNIEKYGVEHPMQLESVRDKQHQTVLDKYGVDNVSQLSSTREKIQKTWIEKYGVDNPMKCTLVIEKMSDTIRENHGVAWPMQSDKIKQKRESTYLEHYGETHPLKSEDVQMRVKQTLIDKYGQSTPMNVPEFRDKYNNTMKDKYRVSWPMESEDIRDKAKESMIKLHGVEYSRQTLESLESQIVDPSRVELYKFFRENPVEFISSTFTSKPTVYDICQCIGCTDKPVYDTLIQHNCQNLVRRKMSKMEHEVIEFIRSLDENIQIIHNDKKLIAPMEIDIYLPEYKLGIECNPTVTHNSSFCDPWGNIKAYNYHQNKSMMCDKVGIQLYHIFGYEWANRRAVVESMIRNLLSKNARKVYARNCYVCDISYEECKRFLDNNHKQGNTMSSTRLGLKLKFTDELVSVMTFGKIRNMSGKSRNYEGVELSRFCNKIDTSVAGGASKLFNHFIKTHDPDNILSFSDVAHTSGKLYEVLGFHKVSISDPGYVWVDLSTDRFLTRVNCQKSNLVKLFDDVTEDTIRNSTERQIMEQHGYARVYDSGVVRWEWTSEHI